MAAGRFGTPALQSSTTGSWRGAFVRCTRGYVSNLFPLAFRRAPLPAWTATEAWRAAYSATA